jgi:hypothetical protein
MLQNEPKGKVKYICWDDSGENHDIQNYLRDLLRYGANLNLQHQIHYKRMGRLKVNLILYMEE